MIDRLVCQKKSWKKARFGNRIFEIRARGARAAVAPRSRRDVTRSNAGTRHIGATIPGAWKGACANEGAAGTPIRAFGSRRDDGDTKRGWTHVCEFWVRGAGEDLEPLAVGHRRGRHVLERHHVLLHRDLVVHPHGAERGQRPGVVGEHVVLADGRLDELASDLSARRHGGVPERAGGRAGAELGGRAVRVRGRGDGGEHHYVRRGTGAA